MIEDCLSFFLFYFFKTCSTLDMYYMCSVKITLNNILQKVRDTNSGNGEKLPADSFSHSPEFSFLLLVIVTQFTRDVDDLERLL